MCVLGAYIFKVILPASAKYLKISYFPVDRAKNLCIVQANVLCLNKIR